MWPSSAGELRRLLNHMAWNISFTLVACPKHLAIESTAFWCWNMYTRPSVFTKIKMLPNFVLQYWTSAAWITPWHSLIQRSRPRCNLTCDLQQLKLEWIWNKSYMVTLTLNVSIKAYNIWIKIALSTGKVRTLYFYQDFGWMPYGLWFWEIN